MTSGQGGSLVRALRVLEAVSALGDGVTAKAIARRLGCPLPTVYRALGTLVEEGYLVRLNAVRGYGLGYKVAELHRGLTTQVRPSAAVRGLLHEVHDGVGAAAYLAVRRDVDVVVAHVDRCAEHPGPLGLRVGEPAPVHATALGKVLLAGLAPAELGEVLERTPLTAYTPRTLADRRGLDRELQRIRAAGAAVEVEEFHRGVAGVAVALRGATAAVGVAVSRAEFSARRWELEHAVREAADRVSRVLTA
ncbi:helix-turn-helix domain-containing protein [Pseudonocardia kujensis]|uniref:IclR family transcriptional regulator n=1 Tax=Pseudonocardia kujensis TaxID=1128675 RepID=UPI001E631C2E|nr:IclR family transcriptional regulator C-terminal domain-containing protein [Pseudonocardia kujensis]MCE0761850.1 helix-turn-helix domain-containing protein [Pseudonocardia kujensis]